MTHPTGQRALTFSQASHDWLSGLPLGNGRVGVMATGDLRRQTLHLNEETFWSPGTRERDFTGARESMTRVRQHLAEGEVLAAQAVARPLLGDPPLGSAYQPIGGLLLTTELSTAEGRFQRSLELATGLARFSLSWPDGRHVSRQLVAAREPSVVLVRQTAVGPTPSTFVFPSSPFEISSLRYRADGFVGLGHWHEVQPNRALIADSYRLKDFPDGPALQFAVGVRVLDGEASVGRGGLHLSSPEWAIAVTVATNFSDSQPLGLVEHLLGAVAGNIDEEFTTATSAHEAVFRRASIQLTTPDPGADMTTAERVHLVRAGGVDDHLVLLLSDFGRYLQIASTLGGAWPPNLQGIWNADTEPAWGSNYTLNINLQMCLWSAASYGFFEAVDVLRDFLERVAAAGARTAAEMYGARGWVVHHNCDVWLNTAPTTLVEVGLFAGAGPWLVLQLLQQLESTSPANAAAACAPLVYGAAEFIESWLVEDDEGFLVTAPSSTPENAYLLGDTPRPESRAVDPDYRRHGWIGEGSTLEMLLVRDLLLAAVNLAEADPQEQPRRHRWAELGRRLRPLRLDKADVPEWTRPSRPLEVGHRHLSALYGVYPGDEDVLTPSPLREAAYGALTRRQANVTSSSNGWGGWSRVWAAACWARLGEGDRALASLESLVRTGITPNSLLHAFPEFDGSPAADAVYQADANMGIAAVVAELIIQTHQDRIDLLPALPARWTSGTAKDLRVRGGRTISLSWVNGEVRTVSLSSHRDEHVLLTAPHATQGRVARRISLRAQSATVLTAWDLGLNQGAVDQ